MVKITNEDNMLLMARYEDNHFDLAIVDPPYGIGISSNPVRQKHKKKDWDNLTPNKEYFKELFRVSKNQIVFGGNYFIELAKIETPNLKIIEQFNKYITESSENWLFWYKQNPVPNFADGELAWLSFNENKQFNFRYYGNLEGNTSTKEKIHPTQKPVKLYEWLLINYAKEGDKILDTHGGSLSIALAIHNVNSKENMNLSLDVCELDIEYFQDGKKRYENHIKQKTIFDI
jgi:site-specific DNA-methyltransferase (adenine-specific)